jgi:hypothetical protein
MFLSPGQLLLSIMSLRESWTRRWLGSPHSSGGQLLRIFAHKSPTLHLPHRPMKGQWPSGRLESDSNYHLL